MVQERPIRVERRLSAILAADVAGYSRLMHTDEELTHAKLAALLADVVNPAIAEHRGRIVKNTGDGFLAEFSSAVQAVRAAVQFQALIKELTIGDPDETRIAFRVGINIGDVIVEPHDIFGDGVNKAVRLESIAEAGGICVSASVYEHIRGKVDAEFADMGEQYLKNIAHPVRAYAMIRDGGNPASETRRIRQDPVSPPHFSVVVLPFTNLSGDGEQDYFVDGVTESLTTDLSRIRGSFVIGRHTAFTYRGKVADLKQIGRELNVRYVLDGSIQRDRNRLRVNVHLVDTETGSHLWADRFDKPIADLLDMQDEIVPRLANAANAQLIEAEARRAENTPNPDAMDLIFRGRHSFNEGLTSGSLTQARVYFERALAIEAENIDATVWLAAVDVTSSSIFLIDDLSLRLATAETVLLKALSHAPNHPFAHLLLGIVLMHTNRALQGLAECERALELDRNFADAHAMIGLAKYMMGCGAETEAHVNEALRLSPRDILAYRWLSPVGFSKLQVGADNEAVGWFLRAIEVNRNYPLVHFGLAAALALLGKPNDAYAAAKAGQALDPTFTIRRAKSISIGNSAAYLEGSRRILKGLRMAGVPEG